MGGTAAYTTVNGKLVTLWMAWQILRLDAAFFAVFGLHLIVADAIRTYADQERVFRERYVTAGNVRGRRVYDTRMWNGVRWYRISAAGTVAVPGTSNHEIQGTYAAVDFWDTGSDPGVSRAGTARANWLRANAHRFDFEPEGYGFNEAWHYRARNIFNIPPAQPAPSGSATAPRPPSGDEPMYIQANNDGAFARKGNVYVNDIQGHWRGITNLEFEAVKQLVGSGLAVITAFDGSDLDLMFAVSGVWEQPQIDSNAAPRWGKAPGTPLMGLGALTGRLMYPGSSEWHYPRTAQAPGVDLSHVADSSS